MQKENFKKNRKYEKLIKQNETKASYDRISEFIKLQTEFTVEEIIENLEIFPTFFKRMFDIFSYNSYNIEEVRSNK